MLIYAIHDLARLDIDPTAAGELIIHGREVTARAVQLVDQPASGRNLGANA